MKRFFSFLAVLAFVFLGSFAQAQDKVKWGGLEMLAPSPDPTKTAAASAAPTASPTPSETPNQAPVKKYLNLGADPQNPDRQPIAGKEEIVIIDEDICDSAWGTGSGKKVLGCYPKNSAVIRDIQTGFVTAMYKCGNEPSQKHKVSGKVLPTTTPNLTAAVATPTPAPKAPLAEAAKNRVERDGDNPVKVSLTVNNNGDRGNMTALVIGGSILLAVLAAIVYDHSKDDSKQETRTPNPRIYTNPTGGLGFGITLHLGGS